jgi:IrrE N-terminal-like domain
MIAGELKVVGQAWECQKAAGIDTVPVPIEKYLQVVHAEMEVRYDLEPDEAGQCFEIGSKRIIWINGNHSPERQRFTALHEIAHLYLNTPPAKAGGFARGDKCRPVGRADRLFGGGE